MIAMCLGALIGLSLLAWSLDMLVPPDARSRRNTPPASETDSIADPGSAETF